MRGRKYELGVFCHDWDAEEWDIGENLLKEFGVRADNRSPPLATLENIWDIDSSDPTYPQEFRQKIL